MSAMLFRETQNIHRLYHVIQSHLSYFVIANANKNYMAERLRLTSLDFLLRYNLACSS